MGTDGPAGDLAPDQSVHVVAASGRRPCLLAFGGLQGRLGMPVFEFMNLTAGWDVHRVFVRDLDQAWYHRGVRGLGRSLSETTEALRRMVEDLEPERLVVVGNSAGGFAALYFGPQLAADRIIAFSPTTVLDRWRRFVWRDPRWWREIRRLRRDPPRDRCYDVAAHHRHVSAGQDIGPVDVYYSGSHRLDRLHVRHLVRGNPHVLATAVDEPGHTIVRALRDRGQLQPLLHDALVGP